jgi:hypothetical protein
MKLTELFQNNQVSEAFGDTMGAFARKTSAALNPTASGQGARDLENKTNKLTKNWMMYRGQTKAIPNASNIGHWVKTRLGLDDPEIWAQAVDEFSEEYPKAGVRYKNEEALNPTEISNFFNKLIQVRLMNPEKKLWSTTKSAVKPVDPVADNVQAPQNKKTNRAAKNSQPVDTGADQVGLPQHPVYSQSAIHMHPDDPTDIPDSQSNIAPKETNASTPTSKPEPTKSEGPGNAGSVDWDAIRKRFPQKPRISIPMASKKVD